MFFYYSEDQSHVCAFFPLNGNQEIMSFKVFPYRSTIDDIHYTLYDDHWQMHTFSDVAFYSGWLACGSCLMYPHLPKRVMHHFKYLQVFPRDPSVSAPLAMVRRDVYVMYDDFYSHLVPNEAQSLESPNKWSTAFDYIQWYFRVSHPYMKKMLIEIHLSQLIRRY